MFIVFLVFCIAIVNAQWTIPASFINNSTEYDFQILQGDMVYKKSALRNANIQTRKWPGGIIYYAIDPNSGYTPQERQIIRSSMDTIERQTGQCLRFVQRTNQREYIIIRHTNTGCNSYVGQISWQQPQQVSLQRPGCLAYNVVVHELLHAAGFEHEHCRPDRDYHVYIDFNNVQSGLAYAFDLMSTSKVSTLNQKYDFYSIMHYRQDAFSKNGRATIVPRVQGIDMRQVGVRPDMSPTDITKVKLFYQC